MKIKLFFTALALAFSTTSFAQVAPPVTGNQPCPVGVVTCNQSTQTMGDTTQTASADNDQSQTTQAGNHANSIASGVTIDPSIQQSGNANSTQSDNHLSNTATGGAAIGNQSSNDNKSSASTGASSANNTGMNGLGGNATTGASNSGGNIVGPSTATVGPTSNTNSVTGGPISNALNGGNSTSAGGTSTSRGGDQSNVGGAQTLKGGNTKIGDVGSTSGSYSGGNKTQSGATAYAGGNKTYSSADNSGGNSSTSVDASDHSAYNSRLTVLPEQPSVPMSISPASNIAMTADPQCGPYQKVIRTPVYGLFFGITHTKRVILDHDDTLADPTPQAMDSVYGVRAIYTISTINLAGARSISLGGGGSSGGWGQGNSGTTSSMTAQVTHIQLRSCRMAVQVEHDTLVIHDAPQPVMPVAKKIWHKRTVPANCPPIQKK